MFGLEQIPVFVREGSIIPTKGYEEQHIIAPKNLIFEMFWREDINQSFDVYED